MFNEVMFPEILSDNVNDYVMDICKCKPGQKQ